MSRPQAAAALSWLGFPIFLTGVWLGDNGVIILGAAMAIVREAMTNHRETFSLFLRQHRAGVGLALLVTATIVALIVEALFSSNPLLGHSPSTKEAALVMVPFVVLLYWHDVTLWSQIKSVPNEKT